MNNKRPPRVSIGLPVYNGERRLAPTIQSILRQTYPDFEVVVSDNASTDATAAIIDGFARADPRIRVLRQPVNLGSNSNYRAVARAAIGE